MNTHNLKNILVLLVGFNGFALLISSHWYTALSIRKRNAMYYALLHREVNLDRQMRADEIAESVCRFLRPSALVVANLLAYYAVRSAWR